MFLKKFSRTPSQVYGKQDIESCENFVNLILRSALERPTKDPQTVYVLLSFFRRLYTKKSIFFVFF
jgi:hypothetical protein